MTSMDDMCNITCKRKDSMKTHLKSKKHINNIPVPVNLECKICDVIFNNKYSMVYHCRGIRHIHKVEKLKYISENEKEIDGHAICSIERSAFGSIPMQNRKGKIVGFTDVDKSIVDKLVIHSIILDGDGYATISVNGNNEHLHTYIYYTIYGHEKTKGMMVDHNDRVKLNNCISNLDKVTASVNSRNRTKLENATSKYWGVCKDENLWRMSVKDEDKIVHKFRYTNELHAAWHYNLLIKELNIKGANPNDIKEPSDFVRKVRQIKQIRDLPVGVERQSKFKYRYSIGDKHFGGFSTPESASAAKQSHMLKLSQAKQLEQENLLKREIKRNNKGQAIIEIFNKKKVKVAEISVEDSVYPKLLQASLCRSKDGYINISIDGNPYPLGRYLKNCTDPDLKVDHRDGNIYNYLEKNLKITTALGNAQNKASLKNSSSIYVGVNFHEKSNKWRSQINIDKKSERLGLFSSEKEACIVRDLRAFEVNMLGNNFRINLSEEELQYHLFVKALSQEFFDFNYLFFSLP